MPNQVFSMPSVLDASNAASKPIKNEGSDMNRRYSCPHCPYVTRTEKTIWDHIHSGHTTAKDFKCPNCSFSSSKQHVLQAHLKLHKIADVQAPNAAAPASVEPEREMPRPQRRPLSTIGNDRSAALVPARSASLHHPQPRRVSSATAVGGDRERSRRSQFEATKKERDEKERKETATATSVIKEEKERPVKSKEATTAETAASEVKGRRISGRREKEIKTPESVPRTRSSLKKDGGKEKEVEGKEEKTMEVKRPVRQIRSADKTATTLSLGQRRRNSGRIGDWNLEEEYEEKEEEPSQIRSVKKEQEPVETKEVKRRCRKSADEKELRVDREVKEEEPQPEETKIVKRRGRKSAEDKREADGVVKEEEPQPVKTTEVKRRDRKSAEERSSAERATKRPVRQSRAAEKNVEEKGGRVEKNSHRSPESSKHQISSGSMEEKTGEAGGKKATVEVKREEVDHSIVGDASVKKEEERDDELLDVASLDAAIAEAEKNAAREKMRPAFPTVEMRVKEEEEQRGSSARKRVHFAALPEKHHASHMPAKRRRKEGEREGDAMKNSATKMARDFTSFFSSFDTPPSARSISSPDRSGRRATIIEAMKARASQLEQQDEQMEEEERDAAEIKLPFSVTPFELRKKPPIDEFESDEEERKSTMAVRLPIKPVKKAPVKSRKVPIDEFESDEEEGRSAVAVAQPPSKPAKKTAVKPRKSFNATVSPIEGGNGRKKASKDTPVKKARESAARARSAAAAARKREQARAARIRRLKRDLARRLAKSDDRWNVAARAMVEEEDRYWRTATEVTPLEQKEWSGERRLFSWPEIHNARRKMAMEVEPVREEEGKRAESLHAVSTSSYLARTVQLKQRCEMDGLVKTIKSFNRARSPPLDWSYEEAETVEACHPTVPSMFVPGGELRCL